MTAAIRTARQSDAERVAELTRQLGYQLSAGAAAERLAGILARREHTFRVAETDGRVVGWVHAMVAHYVDAEPYVLIGGLVVDSAHRGQRIGRMLVGDVEAWAARQGCSLVRLSSSIKRTAAHRFYEQLGYTVVKTQHAFAKSLAPGGNHALEGLTPAVEEES